MKANEFMIGDWVYNSFTNENYQIWPQFFSQVYNQDKEMKRDLADANIHPIPITPEILDKNGFVDKNVYEDTLGIEIFGNEELNCGLEYQEDAWVFETFVPWTKCCADGSPEDWGFHCPTRILNLKYVHQLQHALRLCGIEKEITI